MGVRLFGLAKIPMVFYLSPKVIELNANQTIIKIPLNWRTKNHLGSMYFAALSAGADISGGLLAMEVIKKSKKNIHLGNNAPYFRKPYPCTIYTANRFFYWSNL